jgi:hypothetical protein
MNDLKIFKVPIKIGNKLNNKLNLLEHSDTKMVKIYKKI